METKITCLHDKHVALGALMSPFAGYDMPIQYKDITTEHEAVRKQVGVFDVSHMVRWISAVMLLPTSSTTSLLMTLCL